MLSADPISQRYILRETSFLRVGCAKRSLILALERERPIGVALRRILRVARLYFCYFLICIVHLRSLLLSYVHSFYPGRRRPRGWHMARAKYNERGDATARGTLVVYGLT